MRLCTTYLLFGLVSVSTAALSGCMSHRAAGDQIAGASYSQGSANSMDLWSASFGFRARYHRWPKDYTELATFVQQSDGKFKLEHYKRVDFIALPNDGCEIYSVSGGFTNRTIFITL
jgi:hypothetical protein